MARRGGSLLAYYLVGGGQVQNQGSSQGGEMVGGRNRRPQILTDFHAHRQVRHILTEEKLRGAEGNSLAAQGDHLTFRPAGRKPSLFVEFPVVGQMGLGYYA